MITKISSYNELKDFIVKLKRNGIIGNKVIFTGIDGAGKTTISNKILSDPEFKSYIFHRTGRDTKNDFDLFKDIFYSDKSFVCDRSYEGQFIYQTSEDRQRKMWLSIEELYLLEGIINDLQIPIIYVYNSIDKCLENCKKDSKDSYYTYEYLEDLDKRFRYFFEHISSAENIVYFENIYESESDREVINNIDYNNFDYSSLPKVVAVDFDGTLVLGKEFPEIGYLNKVLVHDLFEGEYKDYKKVLFTHRSGQCLIDACNFLADNNIYFDAINDDIPEIKKILNRKPETHRKIWFDVMIDDKAINVDWYK